ncbi:Ig-like domain repeat protein [Nocardia sp. GCM10030253]|uniref:Ig-like domain repeat protein n=1 Tax=Nocardia sp. GCM10030253 TaxID=3273404 RepID=UPI003640E721
MQAFNPNDYRKRVLAEVERRGGIEHSDPFELYDIPLDEADTLSESEVAAQVAEVWGFWQRQRDHPKYRVLVGLLVGAHPTLSELVLVAGSRRAEAARVREMRAKRDADRYEMLDTAISRLVQRHGGVPAGKVEGLAEIGAMGGLSAAEVATRLRRHRVIADAEPAPVAPSVLTDQRRRQIRQLLSEWERLLEGPPTPTLFALLGMDSTKAGQTNEIRLRAEALRARSRELPPGRIRVVLDELLIHVHDLLESGDSAVQEYLRAVIEDVAGELRPKVRAAVLVEDQLVGDDFQYLVDEAIAQGLDRVAATRLLTDLATELGARVEDSPRGGPAFPPASPPRAAAPRQWETPLKAARAALRAGRPAEAARQVTEARRLLGADDDGLTPIRSVADEVDRVLAEAALHWRSASAACAAKRYVEALPHLESLQRTASDVPPPADVRALDELLAEARAAIAEADRLVTEAQAGPADARLRGLLDAQAICADHAAAAAALAAAPVEAPTRVEATRMANGSIRVVWSPSSTGTVDYRVTRLQPDGSWRVVGRTKATDLEDGGAPAGPPPVYAVAAVVAGKYSEITRSDTVPAAAPQSVDASPKPTGEQQLSPSQQSIDHSTRDSGWHSRGDLAPSQGDPAHRQDEPDPSGIPAVTNLAEQGGLLVFAWPSGVTEVLIVARADEPPSTPDDSQARAWKVTNARYDIDGGVRIPEDIDRPCHIAIASCRREATGKLIVAAGFAATARIRWER